MAGKQPDQQICEIFFLCLDLIKKKKKEKISHVWLFYTAVQETALESYEK